MTGSSRSERPGGGAHRHPEEVAADGAAAVVAPVWGRPSGPWPDRPVLVAAGSAVGVLAAAALTVILLPRAETRRPTAQPPPAILAPVVPAPTGAASTPVTASPTSDFTPPSGAHTVSSQARRPSPPPPPPPAGPPGLRPLPPAVEGGLRSVSADRETAIEFVNARAEPVIVYWLDYGGRRVRYRVLGAGERYRQHTYVTHPWVVTRLDGRALAVFMPAEQPARATVS